jgi:uncharacterized protein YkwD
MGAVNQPLFLFIPLSVRDGYQSVKGSEKALKFTAHSLVLNHWLQTIVVLTALSTGLVTATAAEGYVAHAEALLSQPPSEAQVAEDIEQAILVSLNAYRASKGRKALTKASPDLIMAARAHALDLLAMGKVGHVASTGHNFDSRMRALKGGGLVMLPAMSENAARDRRKGVSRVEKAQGVMQQWIDSPSHRKSMTSRDFVTVAIGAVMVGDTVYAVQIFSGPAVKTNLFQGN